MKKLAPHPFFKPVGQNRCSEKLFMESHFSVTKPTNSTCMNPTVLQEQHPFKLEQKQPRVTNLSMDGNKNSKNVYLPGGTKSNLVVENPQQPSPKTPQPLQLPTADEILTYKPNGKYVMMVDSSVAAYFADMFRDIRKSLT